MGQIRHDGTAQPVGGHLVGKTVYVVFEQDIIIGHQQERDVALGGGASGEIHAVAHRDAVGQRRLIGPKYYRTIGDGL